ncbi:MAG: ABC-2 family transporter protein [Nanoarchaeota archaeon]|nr:ABC-2 family transporter protein [Nanoarchaeota archaeon]
MRENFALTEAGFKVGLIYRLHYFASLLSVPVSLLIYFYLWKAIFAYSNATVIKGFTLDEMVSYYVLVMLVGFITYSECDKWIEESVVRGDTIMALLKPYRFIVWHYFFELGLTGLGLIIEILPVFVVGFFFGLKIASIPYLILFVISLALASALYFLVTFIVGLTSFWLFKIGGLRRVKRSMLAFLGGSMLPLTFFPETVQNIFLVLPFQYMRYIPILIYLEKYSIPYSITLLGIAATWVILLYVLARLMWNAAFKKFAGAGT